MTTPTRSTMRTEPDGVEVVTTTTEAEALDSPPLLVLEPLEAYLDSHGIGSGPLAWHPVGEGHSNWTFRIQREGADVVLRRGPRPPLPKSAHDMVREARIQRLLADEKVPVPEVLAVCDDPEVIGGAFYVMDWLEGVVVTDRAPDYLDTPEQRRATGLAAVDTLVELHQVDVTGGDLSAIGRPEGYLSRQVERFASLWEGNTERSLPEVAELAEWLRENVPDSARASVVHGDYRIGNLMLAPSAPARVLAVLDWEMATLGDPLADLGYFHATYADPDVASTPLELTSVTRRPGYPRREELAARYAERTGADLRALPWYEALALWKAAIFCEAIYTRWRRGERPEDTTFGPSLEAGVPRLLEQARQAAAH